ncbi:acyl-CoA dehydrogenase family protein [Bradyrhizobium sp. WSM471]|uniref:acyl-CoA dehydrogenase family protein n=1 Tax=Bradyrhizobium sp. WSM471 TaxID=319017 RepID=UPI00024D1D37|nr:MULTISPECIES: acyl-CoA dehydrogenase family protein [Bradyrhizobium]EHR01033.1 acyl-CoA dehydrogenase [Bradyrhizobium sp. WSM471]UFW43090.1 acyl-CoA dehydrogenase family protein [Bradyrhizobium canariense]
MSDLETFRRETQAWLEANCPPEMRQPICSEDDAVWGGRRAVYKDPAQKVWLDLMAEKGWTAPDWPKPYGGGGLSPEETKILRSEMSRLGCRIPLSSFGLYTLGPALLKYGSEEQKLEHLPKLVRGEVLWCQGYSEPGAGSDLASLATRAEDKGDHFLVNGQKIWTSDADKADWIFCLVRTDTSSKHNGISFLLIDMETPGVSVKPIRLISGYSPFCETFLDNVKVPKKNLVGELNKGWDIAKYLLSHERESLSGTGLGISQLSLGEMAKRTVGTEADGRLDDPVLRARIALFEVRAQAFVATSERVTDELKHERAHPAQASVIKYFGTELNKQRYELMMDVGGSDFLEWESERSLGGAHARAWLRTKANSIEGGTSEVQLNIIAKRILQLPGA